MPTAAPLSLPYPSLSDSPDGPAAFSALANRIQQILGQDSGWVAIALSSTFSGTFQYRRVGATVTVMGRITKATNSAAQGGVLVGTVPANYRSSATLYGCGVAATANNPFLVTAAAGGDITIDGLTGTGPFISSFSITYVTSLPSS